MMTCSQKPSSDLTRIVSKACATPAMNIYCGGWSAVLSASCRVDAVEEVNIGITSVRGIQITCEKLKANVALLDSALLIVCN